MSKSVLDQTLNEFGALLELGEVCFNDEGYTHYLTEDGLLVNLHFLEDQNTIVFCTTLTEIEENYRLTIYDEMLKANFFWRDTYGATLSVSPDGQFALLMAGISISDLNVSHLSNTHHNIVSLTQAWHTRLTLILEHEAQTQVDKAKPFNAINNPFPSYLRV